jgi:hypothetical protein
MTKPFFIKFVKIWEKNLFCCWHPKPTKESHIKSNIFLVIVPSSSFEMVCYITMVFYMFPMALTISHFIFNKTMELIYYDYWWPQLSRSMWRSLLDLVMFAFKQKKFVIAHVDSFNHCPFLSHHSFQSPWTSSNICHFPIHLIPSRQRWMAWQRWFISFHVTNW